MFITEHFVRHFLGNFYQNEISIVDQDFHRIAKVLKQQGNKSYVSFRGYPQRFNSWVKTKDLKNIDELDNR